MKGLNWFRRSSAENAFFYDDKEDDVFKRLLSGFKIYCSFIIISSLELLCMAPNFDLF